MIRWMLALTASLILGVAITVGADRAHAGFPVGFITGTPPSVLEVSGDDGFIQVTFLGFSAERPYLIEVASLKRYSPPVGEDRPTGTFAPEVVLVSVRVDATPGTEFTWRTSSPLPDGKYYVHIAEDAHKAAVKWEVDISAFFGNVPRPVQWDCCFGWSPTSVVVIDTTPPVVKARRSKGRVGRAVKLRYLAPWEGYKVWVPGAGRVWVQGTVRSRVGGKVIKRLPRKRIFGSSRVQHYKWRAPSKLAGKRLVFCVRGTDKAGNKSRENCAPLRIRA